ncbi:MAG TPA: glycosyltransferase [Candidatus Eremiobacteraceae bacterium]|nr:glycosyltransferase [Candidatus Eremiobacteraceae bacterium]
MSSLTDNGTRLEPDQPAASQTTSPLPSGSPDAIFLMINSLETGGTERQFVEIARSLGKDAFQVHPGCLLKKGPFLEGLGELHLSEPGGSLYSLTSIRSRWRLMRHLRKSEIAVAHAFDFYANLMLIPAAKLARVPVVIGSHRQLGDLLTPAKFRAQLMMFRWCDRVVCNSQAAADRLLQAGLPAHKLVVIGNGLPPEAFAQTAPALERCEGILRVGMIARMNAGYKNQGVFLRAAGRLGPRFSNVEFLLVGDGPLRSELEREAADLGLQSRVRFLGDRRDIPAILASIDVSVVPSASESLSNVILESMAAGVPVVATAVGGNCELGGDGRVLLVSPNDDEALAAGLERVLADEELRREISYRARQFAQENFTVERIRKQYCELYSDVLASRSQRSGLGRGSHSDPVTEPRIRVAVVAPSLRYVGGQAVQADLLLRNWKDDPDVEARFVPVDPRLPYGLGWVEQVPFLRTIIREPFYAMSLCDRLKDTDVAHIFSASYASFLLAPLPAWMMARLWGKKTLINYHSGECRDHLRRSHIARRVLKGTDRLVVPSGYLVEVLGEFVLTAQAIPNVVDVSQFSFRVRRPLRPHLVCTRGFDRYYCVDVVVRAFAEVQKAFPDARLDLVGGGPLEGEIRNLVRKMKLTGVDFKGVAAHSEIGRFYDEADIFINASRLDNMPVSVLEAFASGTPVVSTEPEGMRYVVEHGRTGLLSAPGDAAALAQNVIRVLQDPELADRLVSNSRQELERYSWPVVREQWLEVYRALTSREMKAARESASGGIDSSED